MRRIGTRLAVSDAAQRTVARNFPGRYEMVPNGIDVDRFRAAAARPAEMPDRSRFVLFVGRLEPRKGVDRLIRAMAIVQAHAPDARLVIVGDGPDREALEAMARAAGIGAMFAGRVPDDLLPAYYRAADIVCSPALGDESFGIVLLEAMAAGRPIVATRIEGYAELLAPAGCARLVDVDDPAALAEEIIDLLDDPELRAPWAPEALRSSVQYDWDTIARRLESIYLAVLSTVDS